jgi:hypothetical protein
LVSVELVTRHFHGFDPVEDLDLHRLQLPQHREPEVLDLSPTTEELGLCKKFDQFIYQGVGKSRRRVKR